MLLITLNAFRDFPGIGFWLIALGVVYFAGLFALPHLWLIVLPVVTVSLDLATYTGRFLFNEYDLLFLTTIAFSLISGRFSLEVFKPSWGAFLITSYCLIALLGFSAWGVFFSPPGEIVGNPYYMPEYGYKVIKGMLWALLLVPFWLDLQRKGPDKAIRWLVVGQCVAALVLGLVILWERGTLGVLVSGTAWYHMVSSLLDLSSSYRTTGIFSDMHTGGEVVDGVILLLLPMALYGLCQGSNNVIRILSLAAFGSLAYCTTVGFTRATYVSFFVGIVTFVVLHVIVQRRGDGAEQAHPYGLYGLTAIIAFCAAYFAFFYAGSFGVASYVGLALSAFIGGWLFNRNRWLAIGVWVMAGCLFFAMAVDAHFSSRWVDRSGQAAFIIVGVLLIFYLFADLLFVRIHHQSGLNRFLLLALLIMLPAGFSIAFGGYKINERMENIAEDMESRMTHWRNVIQSSNDGLTTQLFGNGVGSFPANYVYSFPNVVGEVGSFSVKQNGYDTHLSIGPGVDLAFGQRVPVIPNTTYNLSLNLRAEKKGKVVVFICERNLIFASNFMANCQTASIRFNPTANNFEHFSATLDTKGVGKRPWLKRWPTTLYLKNFSKDTVVDIDEIMLTLDGQQLLKNSDFSKGTDEWFFYNDFEHLPWHIKNTFLQAWYNFGWIGLVLFLSLGAATLFLAMSQRSSPLAVAFASGVIAVAAFGVFGTPLDSARVSWMFYFYIFAVLLGTASIYNKTSDSMTVQSADSVTQ